MRGALLAAGHLKKEKKKKKHEGEDRKGKCHGAATLSAEQSLRSQKKLLDLVGNISQL